MDLTKYHRDQLLSKSAISIFLPSLIAQGEPLLEAIRKSIPKILTFSYQKLILWRIYGGDGLK